MTRLVVRLLGSYRVELDGEPVYYFETDKARALLAYLVVEADRPHRRETLASLLWPDRPDALARKSLRETLFRVRRALVDRDPPFFFFATRTDVQFNAASDYALDVSELEAFARPHVSHTQLLPEALCGDFLAGLSVADSEAFQAWALGKQEYCHRLALEILDDQNATFEAAGDYDRAIGAARLQLRLEPWLEEAHRRCMRGLALAGRCGEALRQYEACCRALEAELGVEPASSTRALCADIRDGRVAARHDRSHRPVMPGIGSDVAPAPSPAPLIAREGELGQLSRHLAAALAGASAVAFVSGDPGSGKTALLEAFAASAMAKRPDLLVAGARCNPGGHLDPLAPMRKLMEMLLGAGGGDVGWRLAGPEQSGRLRDTADLTLAALREFGPDLADALVPAAFLTHGTHSSWPGGLLSQGELFDQLTRTLAAIARGRPLLLLLDDLHWVDDATAAYLLYLNRELRSSRLLVLGAYRSTSVSVGRRDARSGQVSRHPLLEVINELRCAKRQIMVELDRADGRAFVEAYLDIEPNRLGAPFRDALYAQTGGHALFTVELLHALRERGQIFKDEAGRWASQGSLDWGTLPDRVEAAIAERIGRLPEAEHQILSAACVQGDDFSAELVAEITGQAVVQVLACLSGSLARQHRVVQPEGLQRVASAQRSLYRFTHHLFQRYLYDQLDPIERARLHAAVALALDRQAGDDAAERERVSAQLASHYEAAALPLQAARALHDAGLQATRVSAFREALALFDHGLALLAQAGRSRPAGSTSAERAPTERAEIERLLRVARLVPQRSLGGSGSAQLAAALAQALQAGTSDVQDQTKLVALQAEADHLVAKGQFDDLLVVAERMLDLATQWNDEGYAAFAHFWLGFAHNLMGDPQQAESHFEWIFARQTPGRWAELRAMIGYDVTVHALTFSAINKWFLGYPEDALKRSTHAVALAQELGDMYGLAFASAPGSMTLFLLRSDGRTLQERSELCCRHCEKQGFVWWQRYAEAFLGWLAVMRGEIGDGIERMQTTIAAWQATGMVVGTDCLVVVLADGCLNAARQCACAEGAERSGLLASALARIDGVLGPGIPCGESYQAELHRLRGELLLARDGLAASSEAQACFGKALQLGREQGALAWELRAAMSLVRLRERQNAEGAPCAKELAEARGCLRNVYARFTEGFDFPDLQDAAALTGGHPRQVIDESTS